METDSVTSTVDSWYDSVHPEVSVVILNWNKAQLTIDCVKSLFKHTQGVRYEVIVVDNGSRAEEYALLVAFEGPHKILRLGVNRFFGEGNNLGAESAKGNFVVFMNNDVTVTRNWLQPLIDVFRVYPFCGAAGPKFVYPHGFLQEAGALLDEEGDAVQIGKFQDPSDPRFNRMRVVDYVSAACIVMRKETFNQTLGFDFIYEPAYYEDVDLCLKVGALGLKTFYVPESCIVHHENATTADPSNGLDLNGLVALNKGKLVDRWSHFLKTGRHSEAPRNANLMVAPDVDRTRQHAAIYTARRIDSGESTRYLFSVASALHTLGYRVAVVTPERISYLRISQIARALACAMPPVTLVPAPEMHSPVDVLITLDAARERDKSIQGLARRIYRLITSVADASWAADDEGVFLSASKTPESANDETALLASPVHAIRPAVIPGMLSAKPSRAIILSSGQFVEGNPSSHHELMIEVFRKLLERGHAAELHFMGSLSATAESRRYFAKCTQLASDLPVHFHLDVPHVVRRAIVESASLYWHAGEDSNFGLNVIEAMSSGAIPVIRRDYLGSPDIADGINGFTFGNQAELCSVTERLLNASEDDIALLRVQARAESDRYSMQAYVQAWRELLA